MTPNEIIELLNALLTPTIAILGIYIAFRQYRLSKEKHLSEIYDRRLEIYKSTIGLIRNVTRHFTVKEEDYYEWEASVAEAEFLFGKEVVDLLEDIGRVAYDIKFIKIEEDYQEIPTKLTKSNIKHAEFIDKFLDFYPLAKDLFAPYFNLYKYKKPNNTISYQKLPDNLNHHLEDKEEIPF